MNITATTRQQGLRPSERQWLIAVIGLASGMVTALLLA
jgi:hypothetical protein